MQNALCWKTKASHPPENVENTLTAKHSSGTYCGNYFVTYKKQESREEFIKTDGAMDRSIQKENPFTGTENLIMKQKFFIPKP